jgi:hypothetical protein
MGFWIALTVVVVVTALLFTGAAILVRPLWGGSPVPLGTPITWAGLVALPLATYLGVRRFRQPPDKWYRWLSLAL